MTYLLQALLSVGVCVAVGLAVRPLIHRPDRGKDS